jgi:hypothetical protein
MLLIANFTHAKDVTKKDRSVAKSVKYLSNGMDYDVHAVILLLERDQDQKGIG